MPPEHPDGRFQPHRPGAENSLPVTASSLTPLGRSPASPLSPQPCLAFYLHNSQAAASPPVLLSPRAAPSPHPALAGPALNIHPRLTRSLSPIPDNPPQLRADPSPRTCPRPRPRPVPTSSDLKRVSTSRPTCPSPCTWSKGSFLTSLHASQRRKTTPLVTSNVQSPLVDPAQTEGEPSWSGSQTGQQRALQPHRARC